MVIFFGKGEYDSDELIKNCLLRYQKLMNKSNLSYKSESDISNIKILRNGKPHFEDIDLKFSLSHSHGVFILAFSEFEVGADIEHIRCIEKNKFKKIISCESDVEFIEKWTEIEAFAKYLGRGIDFVLSGNDKILLKQTELEKDGIISTKIPIYNHFQASVVSKRQEIILIKY